MKAELQLSADSKPTPLVAGETIVEFDNVWKTYTRREVLAGVSLKIRKGEVLCVLGPSGTGKSVTIRHINGLEKPDKGDVKVFGESIVHMTEEELSPVRRRVAMLFQGGALFDSMNVEENVGFPLKEHTDKSPREIAELVSEKLLMVGLPGTQRKMPSELSGGMRKRVALARSIALEPEIIMYDEPTTFTREGSSSSARSTRRRGAGTPSCRSISAQWDSRAGPVCTPHPRQEAARCRSNRRSAGAFASAWWSWLRSSS